MNAEGEEMLRKIRVAADLNAFGVEMMRRRLVKEHGEEEGLRRLFAWQTSNRWMGPGVQSKRRLLDER